MITTQNGQVMVHRSNFLLHLEPFIQEYARYAERPTPEEHSPGDDSAIFDVEAFTAYLRRVDLTNLQRTLSTGERLYISIPDLIPSPSRRYLYSHAQEFADRYPDLYSKVSSVVSSLGYPRIHLRPAKRRRLAAGIADPEPILPPMSSPMSPFDGLSVMESDALLQEWIDAIPDRPVGTNFPQTPPDVQRIIIGLSPELRRYSPILSKQIAQIAHKQLCTKPLSRMEVYDYLTLYHPELVSVLPQNVESGGTNPENWRKWIESGIMVKRGSRFYRSEDWSPIDPIYDDQRTIRLRQDPSLSLSVLGGRSMYGVNLAADHLKYNYELDLWNTYRAMRNRASCQDEDSVEAIQAVIRKTLHSWIAIVRNAGSNDPGVPRVNVIDYITAVSRILMSYYVAHTKTVMSSDEMCVDLAPDGQMNSENFEKSRKRVLNYARRLTINLNRLL